MKKTAAFFLVTFLTGVLLFAGSSYIKVIVGKANIRSKPDFTGPVIAQKGQNALLEFVSKSGEWYLVKFSSDDGRSTLSGYIHRSVVQEIVETRKTQAAVEPPVEKTQPVAVPQDKSKPAGAPLREEKIEIDNKDVGQMKELEQKIRQESIALLSLIKQMRPEQARSSAEKTIEMARAIIDGAEVHEAMDLNSRIIYGARINEEFEILERNDRFYRVRLRDGREGWIIEKSLQVFSAQAKGAQVSYKGVETSEIVRFLDVSEEIFTRITQHKLVADQISSKYGGDSQMARSGLKEITLAYGRIQKYFNYASDFYEKYIRNKAPLFAAGTTFTSRLSAWTELLLGSQSYETQFVQAPNEKNSGLTNDLSVGGGVALSETSRVDLSLATKKDIIQTPYSTTNLDAAYAMTGKEGFRLNAGFNLNTYNDQINDLNDFSRLALRAGADFRASPKTDLHFEYQFLNNKYSTDDINSYTDHHVLAVGRQQLNPTACLSFQFRSFLENSQSTFHKFSDIEPSIGYEKSGPNSHLDLRFLYETLSFSELKLKNYGRAALQLSGSKLRDLTSRGYNLTLTYKNFPNNDLLSYFQIWGRYSSTTSGRFTTTFSPSFYTNLFSKDSASSFTDLRLDWSGSTISLFTGLSAYLRLWHSPGTKTDNQQIVKPHVLDVYGKLGLNLKYIRVGPTVGLHALFASDSKGFFERDGNLFRFGGMFEGEIPLPHQINLSVSGGYEYGFVYSNELAVDVNTGLLTIGDLVQRHPTTFQINSLISVPVLTNLELIGRLNMYKINTDMDQKLSINPIGQSNRFVVLFGVRYRYN